MSRRNGTNESIVSIPLLVQVVFKGMVSKPRKIRETSDKETVYSKFTDKEVLFQKIQLRE